MLEEYDMITNIYIIFVYYRFVFLLDTMHLFVSIVLKNSFDPLEFSVHILKSIWQKSEKGDVGSRWSNLSPNYPKM